MKVNKKYILIGFIGILMGGGLFYVGVEFIAPKIQEFRDGESTSNFDDYDLTEIDDTVEEPTFEFTDFEIGQSEIKYEGYSSYMTGTIKNNSDSVNLEYVEIEFDVYDPSGNLLGRISDTLFGLKIGQTWQYEAMIYYDNAEQIKLNDIRWRVADY